MKKLTKILVLVLAGAMLVLALSSCGLLDKLSDFVYNTLEEAGVDVNSEDYEKGERAIIEKLEGIFGSSSISGDIDAVTEKLEDAGYEVYTRTGGKDDGYTFDSITAAKETEDGEEAISVLFFEDSETAEKYMEENKSWVEDVVENADDNRFASELEFGRDGSVVYLGTKNAIKAAK